MWDDPFFFKMNAEKNRKRKLSGKHSCMRLRAFKMMACVQLFYRINLMSFLSSYTIILLIKQRSTWSFQDFVVTRSKDFGQNWNSPSIEFLCVFTYFVQWWTVWRREETCKREEIMLRRSFPKKSQFHEALHSFYCWFLRHESFF